MWGVEWVGEGGKVNEDFALAEKRKRCSKATDAIPCTCVMRQDAEATKCTL